MKEPNVKIGQLVDCHHVRDISTSIESIMTPQDKLSTYSLIDNDTLIGIEVEVERVTQTYGITPHPALAALWNNVEDGSLRNNGREFVSIPIRGKSVPYALEILTRFLNTDERCIGHEFSERTSVHVHMNVQDFTIPELMSFIYTYLVVEPLLYDFVGQDRKQSIFCIPITQSSLTYQLKTAIKYLNEGKVESCLHSLVDWMKYTGFNLVPIRNYGTIEFRHMYGTLDEAKLINWINLILSIKKFALRNPTKELIERIFMMNTNSEYSYFVHDVFGELSRELNTIDLQDSIEPCVVFLKDLYYAKKASSMIVEDVFVKNPFGSTLMKGLLTTGWIEKLNIEDEIKKLLNSIVDFKNDIIVYEKQILDYKNFIARGVKEKNLSASTIRSYTGNINDNQMRIEHNFEKIKILEAKIEAMKKGEIPPQTPSEIPSISSDDVHDLRRISTRVHRLGVDLTTAHATQNIRALHMNRQTMGGGAINSTEEFRWSPMEETNPVVEEDGGL